MPELREVFEMTTEQMEPDLEAWREQEKRQRRANRNRKIGAFAVAAAISVVAIAVVLGSNRPTPRGTSGVNPTNPTDATDGTAEEQIAQSFADAFGAFDVDRAITFLADDADISGVVASLGAHGLEGTQGELRLFSSLLEGMRYQQKLNLCRETRSSASETDVRCLFGFNLLGSGEFGLGRFGGSSLDVTVRDGEIVQASLSIEVERFSPGMWEPFADWVSANHPEDAAEMYEDETYSGARLAKGSSQLWEQRVSEFVTRFATNPGPPFIGRITRTVDGVPFSLRVPTADWYQFGSISLNKSIVGPQGAEAIIFWTSVPDGGDAAACAGVLDPAIGLTAADLAAAVATAPGTELVSGPSDVAVGGRAAKQVVLTVREDAGCDPGYFFSWPDVDGGPLWPDTPIGTTIKVWIVDTDGALLIIEAETSTQANSALEREIEQIVGSIRFE